MIKENTTENNKLIAEFMGMEDYQEMGEYVTPNYHKSWDWLMPVVAKISRDAKYWEDEYREYLLDVVPYGHIKDVYDAVVNFINQYNK